MNLLENWLSVLVEKPNEILNDLYSEEADVRKEFEALFLPKTKGYIVESSHVSNDILQRLHEGIRGHACEEIIWAAVFWYLADPLPTAIAHDLIDRAVAIDMMGMTRQIDEVQWRLATFDENALYTLVRERYREPQYSTSQFESMLEQYSYTVHSDGILYTLSFYETPSIEKKAALVQAIIRERKNKKLTKYIRKHLKKFVRKQS